jgi:hypothetical protein
MQPPGTLKLQGGKPVQTHTSTDTHRLCFATLVLPHVCVASETWSVVPERSVVRVGCALGLNPLPDTAAAVRLVALALSSCATDRYVCHRL